MKFEIQESKVVSNVAINNITVDGVKYITTAKLAAAYGTNTDIISKNHNRNAERFIEGVHFLKLVGDDLREFKQAVLDFRGVGQKSTDGQNDGQLKNEQFVDKRTSNFMLWSERGAMNHMKILGTDEAWAHFDQLSEFYFNHRDDHAPSVANVTNEDFVKRIAETMERLEGERNQAREEKAAVENTLKEKTYHSHPWTDYVCSNGKFKRMASGELLPVYCAQASKLLMDELVIGGYLEHRYAFRSGKSVSAGYRITDKGESIFSYNGSRKGWYWAVNATDEINNIIKQKWLLRACQDPPILTPAYAA